MEGGHLEVHGRQYRAYLYLFYAAAAVMCAAAAYGTYITILDWAEDGTYVMGEAINSTVIPFENFARLSTWLFFSSIISWYCVSRIGWTRTTKGKIGSARMALLQLMLLGFAIICLYEVLWNFAVLVAMTAAGTVQGMVPDIDRLAISYPDESRPWNLIFATKVFLSGFLISAHAFYLSTRPRKRLS